MLKLDTYTTLFGTEILWQEKVWKQQDMVGFLSWNVKYEYQNTENIFLIYL